MMLLIHHYRSVATTIDIAKNLPLHQGAMADMQTNSVGKPGNRWISHDGNLHCSIHVQAKHALPFLYGQKIINTVKQISTLLPEFKYPNDIYLDGKKLAGILVHSLDNVDGVDNIDNLDKNMLVSFGVNTHTSCSQFNNLNNYGINITAMKFLQLMLESEYGELVFLSR